MTRTVLTIALIALIAIPIAALLILKRYLMAKTYPAGKDLIVFGVLRMARLLEKQLAIEKSKRTRSWCGRTAMSRTLS